MYETDLEFASGTISSSGNILTPAEANLTVGVNQTALSPLDVFDTTKVNAAANAVKYVASGAYWTGNGTTAGNFRPELHAYLTSYATAHSLTEDTLISYLDAESEAAQQPLTHNDLIWQEEMGFFMTITYSDKTFLYYDGNFYVSGVQTGSAFTLPAAVESSNSLRYWHTPTAENATVDEVQLADATHLFLQPNTYFDFTLYVFMAKTDEELDPVINGQRITLFATMRLL